MAVEATRDELGVHVEATDLAWTVEPEPVDATTIRMHATFSGFVRDTPVEESVTVPVSIAKETCTRCSRIAGDYYAGIVQIRATGRDPSTRETSRAIDVAHQVVADMEATGDRNAFVTEVTEREEGIDIKVSTSKIAAKIARRLVEEFGGTWSSSETLVTEDEDGNEVYRVTYAVRLPRFRAGDVIDPSDGDGPVLVRSVQGNLKGLRLTTGERYEAPSDEAIEPAAEYLGRVDKAVETTLVTVEDKHAVQALDPETFQAQPFPARTISIRRPKPSLCSRALPVSTWFPRPESRFDG
jgi:nonsense-mediated mRNA decay protein 3